MSARSWQFWVRLPVIVWRLLWDKRVALLPKIAVVLALVYVLLPMGIIPDRAFGVLGYADDLALLVLAVAWLLLSTPLDAVREAQEAGSRQDTGNR